MKNILFPTGYTNLKVHKNKNSEVEIEGEIPVAALEICRKQTLEDMRANFETHGFRKGHVPEDVFLKHINEMSVLEEAADAALQTVYPQIVEENRLDVIGAPEVIITKLAPGNPVGFKIRAGLMPEIKLPDYKSIAKKINAKKTDVSVSDKKVEDVISQFQKMRAGPKTEGAEEKPAELTDEFVKTFGDFQNVADFKEKIKNNLLEEKRAEETEKRRREILQEISRETKGAIPLILIENELAAMRERFKKSLADAGKTEEEYLKSINKTAEEAEQEQRKYIENQFRTKFALAAIIKKEQIATDPKEVEEQADAMHSRQPEIPLPRWKAYAENMLVEEKVFELLEKQ